MRSGRRRLSDRDRLSCAVEVDETYVGGNAPGVHGRQTEKNELDDSVPFAAEKALIAGLKQAFLVVAGSAVQKYMDRIKDEQEILLAAADVAIQIFALESAVLRAEKILPSLSENREAALKAAINLFAFTTAETTSTAAKKAAYFAEEGDTLTMLLAGIRRFTKYDASGLLQAKRTLADAAIEAEKYIF